jgi:hypothetical protein
MKILNMKVHLLVGLINFSSESDRFSLQASERLSLRESEREFMRQTNPEEISEYMQKLQKNLWIK